MKHLIITFLLCCVLPGFANETTPDRLHLIKTSVVDNQGQLLQKGLLQGVIHLTKATSQQVVWVEVRLAESAFLSGNLFPIATGQWLLEIPLDLEQVAIVERTLRTLPQLNLFVILGEYQSTPSQFKVRWNESEVVKALHIEPLVYMDDLRKQVANLITKGIITIDSVDMIPIEVLSERLTSFFRQQLFQYRNVYNRVVLTPRYPPLSLPNSFYFTGKGYIEQLHQWSLPLQALTDQDVSIYANSAVRIQNINFYTALNFLDWNIRLITMQSELQQGKHRIPGKLLEIRESRTLYADTFNIGLADKVSLTYWGTIYLLDGRRVNLPKQYVKTLRVAEHTENLNMLLQQLLDRYWFTLPPISSIQKGKIQEVPTQILQVAIASLIHVETKKEQTSLAS